MIGRLHPLLIHFPIALVLAAVALDSAGVVTGNDRWRTVARGNLRAAAAFAIIAAIAGWRLALASATEATPLLEWHRWLGTAGAALTATAALVPADRRAGVAAWTYRLALVGAAALVAVAAHLGGLLVWGVNFWRP